MKRLALRSLLIVGFGLLSIVGGLSIYSASDSSNTISDNLPSIPLPPPRTLPAK